MLDLHKKSLADVLDAFASSEPVPGGGSASALTGALGVSLLLMVAGMNKSRTGAPEEIADLAAIGARLRPIREELAKVIEEDSQAYIDVLIALKLPRETDEQKSARRPVVESAMRRATDIPLRTMRLCEAALRVAAVITRIGNPNAVTDAAVGSRLILAALDSAGLNVDVNLPGVKDEAYVRQAREERQALTSQARNSMNLVEHS
jgi:formiminotetrahydrofolate cyclodeaminase